jgi:hypothetical protein
MSEVREYYLTSFDKKYGLTSILETLGGPETTQIFAHSLTSFGNIHDEKALLMARRNDIVCTADQIDQGYLEFLEDLGVGPGRGNVITVLEKGQSNTGAVLSELLIDHEDSRREIERRISSEKKIILHPFKTTMNEFRLSKALEEFLNTKVSVDGGAPEIVDYVNLKHNAKTKALEMGLPVPGGQTVHLCTDGHGPPENLEKLEEAIRKMVKVTGKAIVRGSYGSSGSSIEIVPDENRAIQDALEKILKRDDNRTYLVETMLGISNSTNVIFHVQGNNGKLRCVSATDQMLNEKLEYRGSLFPSKAQNLKDMIRSAGKLSEWLQSKGYVGLVGFDFGEYADPENGEMKYFFAEINPRVNASAYPRALMDNLNLNLRKNGSPEIEAFLSAKVETRMDSFSVLKKEIGRYFFRPETGRGLVPYNIGRLKNGMFNAIFFGRSILEVRSMYSRLTEKIHQG